MFRHFCVILGEIQDLYFALFHKFLKLKTVKIAIP
jgi:hypothetical protein